MLKKLRTKKLVQVGTDYRKQYFTNKTRKIRKTQVKNLNNTNHAEKRNSFGHFYSKQNKRRKVKN